MTSDTKGPTRPQREEEAPSTSRLGTFLRRLPYWAMVLAVALFVYATLGVRATIERETSVRNVFDEMILEGPRTHRGLPFPWLPGGKRLPNGFEENSRGTEPDHGGSSYIYSGDIGRPWDGSGDVSTSPDKPRSCSITIGIWDDGTAECECHSGYGVTPDGTECYVSISWSYQESTAMLSWEETYRLRDPGAETSRQVTRQEWLGATGVDGAALDAWADRSLGLALGGWLDANAGRGGRFSRTSLGKFGLSKEDVSDVEEGDARASMERFLISLGGDNG